MSRMAAAAIPVALRAGTALLSRVGLSAGNLAKAGTWLKSALWGSNFAKVSTTVSAGALLTGKKTPSAAVASEAANQVRRAAS